MSDVKGMKAVGVGASRGFGRGIAEALLKAGADVYALSRSDSSALVRANSGSVHTIIADGADPGVGARGVPDVKPNVGVLKAGATPTVASVQDQTREIFSRNSNNG